MFLFIDSLNFLDVAATRQAINHFLYLSFIITMIKCTLPKILFLWLQNQNRIQNRFIVLIIIECMDDDSTFLTPSIQLDRTIEQISSSSVYRHFGYMSRKIECQNNL
ncbi:hypothetical protein DERF_001845 [Dermatophagoides farinae]|uniref:Uncharacterized protein n=1 Tax=Dermatophagoides farinae TaxID=6954 RepID=A0A922IFM9_DERFA|nr:hypothetical protein DERF_001845 [Dermatophagoides farinae]